MKVYAFADEASPNIDKQIEAMLENHLDGLEIRNVDGVNIADITEAKAYEVRNKMDSAGLKVWSVGSPIGKIDIENAKEHAEKFKNVLKTAQILGAENIRIFSYFMPDGFDAANYKDTVTDSLKRLLEMSVSTGITLCHENEKGIYGDIPERCLEIHEAIPEIRAVFDPANYIQCGADTLDAWKMIKPYVKYLHIKDALADGSVVPAGMGIGNLEYILNDFKKIGDSVTIEPHLSVFEGLDKLENTKDKSVVGRKYVYPTNRVAFNAAVEAFNKIKR